MELASIQTKQGQTQQAFATLADALLAIPAAASLIAPDFAQCAIACQKSAAALTQLQAIYAESPSLDVLDAIVALEAANADSNTTARDWYARHLEKEPSLVAAAKWIAGEKLEHEQFHPQVQRALDHAVKPLTRYRCAACGFEAKQYFWQCPGCQAWDSYPTRRVEEL
jgi:lipopolysaccharide biosynthesis regulator YciM